MAKKSSTIHSIEQKASKVPKKGENHFDDKPRIFVGSSSENLDLADLLCQELNSKGFCYAELWRHGKVFGVGRSIIDELLRATINFDFAVMVFNPDDVTEERGKLIPTVRDNVLFELGLFMGAFGKERAFMVYRSDKKPKIATDLGGVIAAIYNFHPTTRAGLSNAVSELEEAVGRSIREHGLPRKRLRQIITRLVNNYPQGIQLVDLQILEGSGYINFEDFGTLYNALLSKTNIS